MAKKSCTYVIVYEPGAILAGTYSEYRSYIYKVQYYMHTASLMTEAIRFATQSTRNKLDLTFL